MRAKPVASLLAAAGLVAAVVLLAFPIHGREPGNAREKGLLDRVAELEEKLERLEGVLKKQTATVAATDAKASYLRIGDELLICWGRAMLPDGGTGQRHVRTFEFRYPAEFAGKPAVTTGFALASNGHVFGVYSIQQDDHKAFVGHAFDNKTGPGGGADGLKVEMSYVAVGKPKIDPKK